MQHSIIVVDYKNKKVVYSMIKSFKYLKPYIISIIFIFIFVAARALLDLALPNYMGQIFDRADEGFSGIISVPEAKTDILYLGLQMLGIIFLSIAVTIIGGFLEARVSANYAKRLRDEVYKKIEQFSLTEMDELSVSSLITRTTNDIQTVQMTVNMLLRMIILTPFMAIGAIIMALNKQPALSMVLIASISALIILVIIVFVLTIPKFSKMQKLVDKLNLVTRENLKGLKVVRAYNMEDYQQSKTSGVADESRKTNIFVNRIFTLMWPGAGLIMGLTSVAMAYLAIKTGIVSVNSEFTGGDLSALIQYSSRTIMSFMMLTHILISIPRASISAKRIMEVIDKPIVIYDTKDAYNLPDDINGVVEFKDVSFSYPNSEEAVLENINFIAKPNQTTAFIGSTGSGKSTLINLLPRLYDATSGSITIDGIPVKDIKLKSLYQHIGYIPQKGNLFKGTIKSNIGFSNLATEKSIMSAAKTAQAEDFILKYEDQYDQEITQGGSNVSGGQRQRLSIARALATEAKILIFDDSFSALDFKTDKNLRNALKETPNKTILIVAQRINTIKEADQIIVLDQGKIVGIGKHHDLLKTNPIYLEIAQSQLSEEELTNG